MSTLRRLLGVMILLLATVAGALFAVQNTQPVPLDLLFVQLEDRAVALWILLAFGLGCFFGIAAGTGLILRQRGRLSRSRRQMAQLEVELDRLRRFNLTDHE